MVNSEGRLAAFFDTSQPRLPFNDEQIDAVARLLARSSSAVEKSADRSPRTYIILRIIGRLDILPRLLHEGFSDGWFPITQRGLPGFIDPQAKNDIFQNQSIILTKSLDLEQGQHCIYDIEEQRPFEVQSYVGSGSFGQVRIIESRVSYKQYALKTIRRRIAFGTQSKKIMAEFYDELRIMKRLNHRHVVRYIGSYTDRNDLGLVMSPVADCDLDVYLKQACISSDRHPTLRTFFGCLVTALSYLHDEGIKHRDIKPKNILVHKANVLLADFGISREFLDTTSGPTTATQRYCAPEVAAYEGRNASADVWSLGCVFLEMQGALHHKDLAWVKTYYETHGTCSTHYHTNPQATDILLQEWQTATDGIQAQPLAWIRHMLTLRRKDRPTAIEVMNEITASDSQVGFMYSCDQCCYSPSDSESMGSLEDSTRDRAQEHLQDASMMHSKARPSRSDKSPTAGTKEPTRSYNMLLSMDSHKGDVTRSIANNTKDLARPQDSQFRASLSDLAVNLPAEHAKQGAEHRHLELRGSMRASEESVQEVFDPSEQAKVNDLDAESSGEQQVTAALTIGQVLGPPQVALRKEIMPSGGDLYDADEPLQTGLFSFECDGQPISVHVTVPKLVVYCAGDILRAEKHEFVDRLNPKVHNQSMTQERFELLRDAITHSRNVRMHSSEMPILLRKYLECLKVPIIPHKALSKWPIDGRYARSLLGHGDASPEEQCLAIFNLEPSRRDLLLYLLGYMASYRSIAGANKGIGVLLVHEVYRPVICGTLSVDSRAEHVLISLVMNMKLILTCLGDGDWSMGKRMTILTDIFAARRRNFPEYEYATRAPFRRPGSSLLLTRLRR